MACVYSSHFRKYGSKFFIVLPHFSQVLKMYIKCPLYSLSFLGPATNYRGKETFSWPLVLVVLVRKESHHLLVIFMSGVVTGALRAHRITCGGRKQSACEHGLLGTWVQIPVLPLTSCEIWGKGLNLCVVSFVSQFLQQ